MLSWEKLRSYTSGTRLTPELQKMRPPYGAERITSTAAICSFRLMLASIARTSLSSC